MRTFVLETRAMAPPRVKIKRRLLGGYVASYHCPHCSSSLNSPLDDAGKSDTCPQCGASFVVPGADERAWIEAEKAAAMENKRKAAIAAKDNKGRSQTSREPKPSVAAPNQSDADRHGSQHNTTVADTSRPISRRCPFCGEEILNIAKKCKHCGEFLNDSGPQLSPPTKSAVIQTGRGPFVSGFFGALGVVAAIILVLILGALLFRQARDNGRITLDRGKIALRDEQTAIDDITLADPKRESLKSERDVSPKQAIAKKREKYPHDVEELIRNRWIEKVELRITVPHVWVTPVFNTLPENIKADYLQRIYAAYNPAIPQTRNRRQCCSFISLDQKLYLGSFQRNTASNLIRRFNTAGRIPTLDGAVKSNAITL
jgi:hypothetical protein